jgi:hypothetical protein
MGMMNRSDHSVVVYVFNLHGMGRPPMWRVGNPHVCMRRIDSPKIYFYPMYACVESIPRKSIFRLPGRIYGNGRHTDSEIAERFYDMNRIRILPTKFAFKDHFILKIQLPK